MISGKYIKRLSPGAITSTNPELDYRVHNTANFVAEKLASFGINHIETGIAETGVVAVIQGTGGDGPTIGLRADMDAYRHAARRCKTSRCNTEF
ncbi:hypothetical protein ASD99_21280 [Mesorhizobium sp. Root695]|nr:hypothetical protein ASD99_21280 [Mesorhizobium sp. Root695]